MKYKIYCIYVNLKENRLVNVKIIVKTKIVETIYLIN
jgi:hypothetical protein